MFYVKQIVAGGYVSLIVNKNDTYTIFRAYRYKYLFKQHGYTNEMPNKEKISKVIYKHSYGDNFYFICNDGGTVYYLKINRIKKIIIPSNRKIADIIVGKYSDFFVCDDNITMYTYEYDKFSLFTQIKTSKNKKIAQSFHTEGKYFFRFDNNTACTYKISSNNQAETKPIDLSNIVEIAVGHDHSVYMCNENEVYGFGSNKNGQLGMKDTKLYSSFIKLDMPSKEKLIRIYASDYSTFFLFKNGVAFATGKNTSGHLGVGDDIDRNKLTKVKCDEEIVDIVVRKDRTFFICKSKSVYGAGLNMFGKLVFGDKIKYINTPKKNPNLKFVFPPNPEKLNDQKERLNYLTNNEDEEITTSLF